VPPPTARERILDAAFRLFYARGIRAVGVDLIIAESGVAKATFYKHFPAKDDLVLAYLDREESTLELLVQQLARQGVPAPVVGYELGDQGWQAELAWPDRRIAVVLTGSPDDPEVVDRDRAYAAAGWHARTAREWSVHELAAQLAATSGGEGR
jgi:AcrR family transcriptional regulator